jgi:hypothetical protein
VDEPFFMLDHGPVVERRVASDEKGHGRAPETCDKEVLGKMLENPKRTGWVSPHLGGGASSISEWIHE